MAGALAQRVATIEVADDIDVIDLDAELDELIAELAVEELALEKLALDERTLEDAIPVEQIDVPTWKIRVGLMPDWKIWAGAVTLVVAVLAATIALRWYVT